MSATAFQRMRREQAAEEAAKKLQKEKPIDKMTIAELKVYADDHNIDLGEAAKKDDILAAIQVALIEEDEGGEDNAGE